MRSSLVTVALLGAGIALLACLSYFRLSVPLPSSTINNSRTILLDGKIVRVTVADTDATRDKGLGGREGLAKDEGMLFVFDSDDKYGFWMKDMRFPIDILWLSSAGRIVDMRESVSLSTYPVVFEPIAPARYVLELPAGFAEVHNIKIGDEVAM